MREEQAEPPDRARGQGAALDDGLDRHGVLRWRRGGRRSSSLRSPPGRSPNRPRAEHRHRPPISRPREPPRRDSGRRRRPAPAPARQRARRNRIRALAGGRLAPPRHRGLLHRSSPSACRSPGSSSRGRAAGGWPSGETPKHGGLAQAGFIIGIVSLVLAVVATIFWIAVLVLALTDDEFRDDFERRYDDQTVQLLPAVRSAALAARLALALAADPLASMAHPSRLAFQVEEPPGSDGAATAARLGTHASIRRGAAAHDADQHVRDSRQRSSPPTAASAAGPRRSGPSSSRASPSEGAAVMGTSHRQKPVKLAGRAASARA